MQSWVVSAIAKISADYQRSADTHLIKVDLPALSGISLYLKDESTHPTGSLKHRLARSLFLYGLCNGWIEKGTPIIEASSGSTAVSEAYFSQLLGLPFIAVMPKHTSQQKIDKIKFYGGRCEFVEGSNIYAHSHALAKQLNGHFMDQFTYAERATDWRGNNNIAESIFEQMSCEPQPIPSWVVVGAGTGGTSATIGRYIRYCCHNTKLCVADPEFSVFYDYFHSRDASLTSARGSRIEGIGRPRVEPSFMPAIIDAMEQVPDAGTVASLQFLEKILGRKCGGSTGTNVFAAFKIMAQMHAKGEQGSVVSLICDGGERYLSTYYNSAWVKEQQLDLAPYRALLMYFYTTGEWQKIQLSNN